MLLLPVIVLAAQFSGVFSLPLEARHRAFNAVKNASKTTASSAAVSSATATPANAEGDELELTATFGTPVALGGGDVKTDVLFPKGVIGIFEVEFQDKNANTLTVTENKTPGTAPAGFAFLDPSTYKIVLDKGADNLTLQKVDFIFDPTLATLKDVDISKSRVGKLCTETNTFVISEALGEEEFEDDENEVTLTVKNMIGEWGVFIPTADVTNGETKEEAKDETEIAGEFDKAIATPAGNSKTDILFTASAAGLLEVEVNATLANAVTVKVNKTPVAPPKGFLFVDPVTYQISTASATGANDVVKVDYIFSAAVLAAADVKQGVIGKLDTATNQFIVDPAVLKAEFEFEEDENEWTLTVPDLNGEWAILIPQAAALKSPTALTL
ncbi:hypothetical protein CVT25_005485 [Psilocybe cyanescens]|uniref:Uncharacterized protein n=1 Tax=Psilocybe cyanescens TaxID=93625 RepID=A0A409XS23_PSICY|nr:hypothetical protein CVT25_005485 [Psilocybe cyanescens]